MMARSRPRARIAALKAAARFAPEAVRITSETTPIPIPTAPGCVRRQCSEATAAIPTTTATTRSQGGASPRCPRGWRCDRERAQVDRRVDDSLAAAALLVAGLDDDVGAARSATSGQAIEKRAVAGGAIARGQR
jgi:hypothetical protein